MQYRNNKSGQPISILGFGCMRFPKKGASIDQELVNQLIKTAIESGINYFDTAYIYPGSEASLGEALETLGLRDKVNIATKLPQYLIKSEKSIDKIFNEELSRLRTDHADYYLMHMLTDELSFEKLKRLGIEDWIQKQKASGKIKNIGFSFHGNTQTFIKILDAYDWDFCQIQYNYMDENSQAGRAGLMEAARRGIPVIIMEPLRGGKLVSMLPKSAKTLIAQHPSGKSAASWAFNWLWDQEQVTCVLSGMNKMDDLLENIKEASNAKPNQYTKEDFAFIDQIKAQIDENLKVPCTGCGYCQPCPKGVDIPAAFRCYNELYMESKSAGRLEYMQLTALKKNPTSASNCIGCGACEQHCPQHIDIREQLRLASKQLETPIYKAARFVVSKYKLW